MATSFLVFSCLANLRLWFHGLKLAAILLGITSTFKAERKERAKNKNICQLSLALSIRKTIDFL